MDGLNTPARIAGALLPRVWSRLPTRERHVFLTFDDGPSEATPGVLDALAEHDARATFFVLGERSEQHPDVISRALRAGHTLGSHGWRHSDPWRVVDPQRWTWEVCPVLAPPPDLASLDLSPSSEGDRPQVEGVRWLRPPYGHVTPGLLRHAIRHDRHIALWDVMPADFDASLTPGTVVDRILKNIRPGSIVVLHDGPEMAGRIEPILRLLLPRLRDDGWQMKPLPDQPRTDV